MRIVPERKDAQIVVVADLGSIGQRPSLFAGLQGSRVCTSRFVFNCGRAAPSILYKSALATKRYVWIDAASPCILTAEGWLEGQGGCLGQVGAQAGGAFSQLGPLMVGLRITPKFAARNAEFARDIREAVHYPRNESKWRMVDNERGFLSKYVTLTTGPVRQRRPME
eukprot:9480160-Pyramimonas_sp.AAC.1